MASVMPPKISESMAEAQQILCPFCHKPNLRRAKFCQHCGQDVVLNNDGPRYYITRIIKEGGQGAVYETIGDDGKVYAVKEMLDRFTDPKEEAEAVERFEAEAELLRRLKHERIPKVYVDFKDEGRQYLSMEFVRGQDLEDVIKQRRVIPEQQALQWASQIFDVLAYLHGHKPEPIIFRDMKPSNVMVEPDTNVKLIDFGIAKVFQHAQRGTQIGTPGYAPPEQYQGLATPASDIYAFGATLHHMLTGRDPRDEPPFSFPPIYGLNPRVSKRTSDAIQKALQMKPEDRYATIEEFRDALLPAPAQVRVAPKTTALPPTPPAATASAARPAGPAAATVPVARPAPTQPAAAQPIQATAAPSKRRGGGFLRVMLVLLLLIGLGGIITMVAFPDLASQIVPGLAGNAPQPTPVTQVYVLKGTYTITDQEILVPTGRNVDEAFREAFVELARQDPRFGPNANISPNAPPAFIGQPVKVREQSGGTVYRATMQGAVFVPQ
jgi:eukaryotic-like serine/threonine-protein kinase